MYAIMRNLMFKLVSCFIAILTALGFSFPWMKPKEDNYNTNYDYVFVHGLCGWGSYDEANDVVPYWGMFGGDLMEYLGSKGINAYAASVSPQGSAWDRACELYAQLTGTVTDYGAVHSEKYGHERYGTDYTDNGLLDSEWSSENKINLLGHSFGGATIRMLAELMANGSAEERRATTDGSLSELFTGGKADWIYSVVALSAPHNGTTAYFFAEKNDTEEIADNYIKQLENKFSDYDYGKLFIRKYVSEFLDADGILTPDNAHYDMQVDNAMALNETLSTVGNIYYFSLPCSMVTANGDGTYTPIYSSMEPLFWTCSSYMGKTTVTTPAGYVCDESWYENDGIVNTISATAPFNAPSTAYDESGVQTGVWNILPTHYGDHMSLQGDMLNPKDIKGLYVDLITMINNL